MMRKFIYSGDVNIENGGYFYCLDNWKYRYADCLRVQPCSDAGGPNNLFWIEYLTVNIRKGNDLQRALDCIGQSAADLMKAKPSQRRHIIIDACMAYGYYDQVRCDCIAIGEPSILHEGKRQKPNMLETREGRYEIDKHLRANASLERYARRELLNL